MPDSREPRSPLASAAGLTYGARFVARLPAFLRRRSSLGDVRAAHVRALATRERRFEDILRRTAFARPQSLLGKLLDHAGIERGDVSELLEAEGLEGTLREMFRHGVYITVDEFKGRTPVRRGSFSTTARPADLRNPLARFHVAAQSGGSRSKAAPFLIDLAYVRASASALLLYLDAFGIADCAKATWETPGAGCRFRLLKYATFGSAPEAWFTSVDPDDPAVDPVFRWSDRAMRLGGRLAGRRLPHATVATREDPTPVLRWIRAVLRRGETPHMHTQPTAVVALSLAAEEAGVDLTGSVATLMGEPTTEARLATIRQSGCQGLPRYGSIEAGPIGYACRRPTRADEVHLVRDLHAMIQPGDGASETGLPPRAILLTALHEAAPFAMLNFSMGDEAVVERDECGCGISALGWNPRLHRIRSFEKFTAAGITFDDIEIVRLLEQTLPGLFGGGPADFQLVEDEGPRGEPTLILRVHPRVGEVDADVVRDAFFDGLGRDSAMADVMQRALSRSVDFGVERGEPHTTRSGKFTHLHVRTRDPRPPES